MKKNIKNISISVRAKLLNLSKSKKVNFDYILLQYFQERLLYRLSISSFKNNFILKGALLFLSLDMPRTRPTKDIDFLGMTVSNSLDDLKKIFNEIVSIKTEDGLIFDPKKTSVNKIQEDEQYEGVRVFLTGRLDTAIKRLHIDIGFGDPIINGPKLNKFPVLIDMPEPIIQTYSKESALAEKLEAIAFRGITTSRLKDFFDIVFVAKNSKFKLTILKKAISTTFKKRGTKLENIGVMFEKDFQESEDKQTQWVAFHSRNKIDYELSFPEIVEKIKPFVMPLYKEKSQNKETWNNKNWIWET